jgi:hypothetical protein
LIFFEPSEPLYTTIGIWIVVSCRDAIIYIPCYV